jgi:OOP family OmpA-OmpF porin
MAGATVASVMIAFLLAAALQGAAPSPPPSPPPPIFRHSHDELLIYHPSGSAAIRPASQEALDEAVRQIRLYKPGSIVVQSHTDTAGSSQANMRLSVRRAEAVRKALVEAGVSAERIELQPLGETAPAVRTADEVAEPINNRTVVILRKITLPPG